MSEKLLGQVGELHLEVGLPVEKCLLDGMAVARVGHHEVLGLGARVDDEVVDDATALVEQERVLRLEQGQCRQPPRERDVEEGARISSRDGDLSHVREVEEPRGGAHGGVLGEVAAVAHGHLPAREAREGRPQGEMLVVQR